MKQLIGLAVLALGCGGGDKPAPAKPTDPTGGGPTTTGDTGNTGTTTTTGDTGMAKKEPPPPAAPDTGGHKVVKPSEVKYAPLDPNNPKGPEVAVLNGDPKTGGAFFLKLPAGMKPGLHTHTADYHAVVISGAPRHWIAGGDAKAKPLAAGSYWFQPGGQPHGDECTGKDPCVVFLIMSGGFDFTPTPTAKPEKTPGKYTLTERKNAKFAPVDPKQPNGLKAAFVFGDPKTGPLAMLLEVPPKGASGTHSHTSNYHAMVLDGSAAHWLPHEKETPGFEPGTYWFQPGGYDHDDKCVTDTPCHAFVYFEKAMDMKPAAAKK